MIQAGFITLTLAMALAIFMIIAKAISRSDDNTIIKKRHTRKLGIMLCGWLIYITLTTTAGLYTVAGLPPRIPLFLVMPALASTAILIRSPKFRKLLAVIPEGQLVYLQSFRIIVEILLWRLSLNGLLPVAATFEGYNYDIAIGITALLIGYLGYTKKLLPINLLIAWNFCGLGTLVVVVFVIISNAYLPELWNHPQPAFISDLGSFPYTFLAGFLMPLAVLLHLMSLSILMSRK